MDVASIQAELHRYYDKLIAGICLIGMDESEPILFVTLWLLEELRDLILISPLIKLKTPITS